ncbi:hypothetical protein [Solidesulfovibrio magneticus]|uniref:hypothetical protein n=1 Tax=Solidesulfovibrio magneticus TaxID=184917 RepID=UPI0011D11C80|nr:hypothetical protein [Solidesulfovibrio magneticus]
MEPTGSPSDLGGGQPAFVSLAKKFRPALLKLTSQPEPGCNPAASRRKYGQSKANSPESLTAKLYLQTLQQERLAQRPIFQPPAIAEIFYPDKLAGHIFYCVNPRSRYCPPNPTTCMMHSPLGTQRKFIPDDEISPMPNTGAQA